MTDHVDGSDGLEPAAELRASEERFRRVFAEAPVGMVIRSLDGELIDANKRLCSMLGYSLAELRGTRVEDILHDEDTTDHQELLARLVACEIPGFTVERRYRHRDGHSIAARVSVGLVRSPEGEPIHLVAHVEDITELRRSEAARREVEQREHVLLGSLPDIIVALYDLELRCLTIRGAIDQLGLRAEDYLGRRLPDLVPAPVFTLLEPHLKGALAGETSSLEYPAASTGITFDLDVAPYRGEDGEVTGILTVWHDITEQRTRERQAHELAQIVDGTGDAIIAVSAEGIITDWNAGAESLYGFGAEEAIGSPASIIVPPELVSEERVLLLDGLSGIPTQSFETRRRRRDGTLVDVSISTAPIHDAVGAVVGVSSVARDISRLAAELTARREIEERMTGIFENAPIGNALLSPSGRIEQANSALGSLCGYTRRELETMHLHELLHPADRDDVQRLLEALGAGAPGRLELEIRFLSASAGLVDIHLYATALPDASGTHRVLCQFQDVSERKRYEQQLQFMADHDPLTGLVNRRKFESELDRHVAHVRRYGTDGAVIVLDVDHFKQVNDTLGHNAGDELIVSVASVLQETLRDSDILGRLGGDEFAILLPHASESEADRVAGRLVEAVRGQATLIGGERHQVTISLGVARFARDDRAQESITGELMLIEADLAMYDAKEAGRDRYAMFATREYPHSKTQASLTWVKRIEQALDEDHFVLAAQPILDLRTGLVRQHELLIRMRDDHGDLIPPATFLDIAERFGLIGRIDEWVSHRAITLAEQHRDLHLEVNISGRSLGDERLLRSLEHRLATSPIDPGRIIFEVTETAAVANLTHAQRFAQKLGDLGCRFALDDFGAGFGSFYYLKHLPFDYIKIDGEFVQHVVTGQIDQLVIDSVVRIARGLGKETIAEFVTDERTQELVTRLGVDFAQGYHIGKPVLVEELFGPPVRFRRLRSMPAGAS